MIAPQLVAIPLVFAIVCAAVGLTAFFQHREKMAKLNARKPQSSPGLESRMDRLEMAMDAIAVEIERIGEGQRFVTKLLAERDLKQLQNAAPMSPGRVVTPH